MHSSITNNIVTLLKAGAFNTMGGTLEPMSLHKWRTLYKAADKLRVLSHVTSGIKTFPEIQITLPTYQTTMTAAEYSPTLFNHWSDKHLMEVREEEMNAPDTSEETLLLLDMIVANAHAMITSDISVEGIISLGRMLRQNKDKTDYAKLASWLSSIGLVQVANLEANILIDYWGFSTEEIPFYNKPYPKASKLYHKALCKVFDKNSFSTATRLNVAMTETLSYNFVKAISQITDIEE